jgi:hypothetical protein
MELPAFTVPVPVDRAWDALLDPSASPRTCLAPARGQARHVTDNADLCDRYRPTFLRPATE